MKVIILTCIHNRHLTLRYCVGKTPDIERVAVCSDDNDVRFAKGLGIEHIHKFNNFPLSFKWNHGVSQLRNIDFDRVVFMGADNWFDHKFLEFVKEESKDFDLLGFTDIYYEDSRHKLYYWPGYKGPRQGEPAGAGKVYSKEFLERIDYDLFPLSKNNGLDGQSWVVVHHHKANIKVCSLRENGLMLCDVKDGQGITPLDAIKGVIKI